MTSANEYSQVSENTYDETTDIDCAGKTFAIAQEMVSARENNSNFVKEDAASNTSTAVITDSTTSHIYDTTAEVTYDKAADVADNETDSGELFKSSKDGYAEITKKVSLKKGISDFHIDMDLNETSLELLDNDLYGVTDTTLTQENTEQADIPVFIENDLYNSWQ